MGGAISVGPAFGEGKIFAGQQGGERFFYCVDADTGELLWKQTVPGGWVWGSAAYDDGMVYVPTVNGYAVCLDAKTGHIVWMYPTAKSVPAEPAIDGDLVYFGSWSGSLYAFDKKTGEIAWKANGIELDSGTLIAYEGKIYVPHHSNVYMSFDAKTGEILSEGNKNPQHTGNFSNFNATPAFFKNRAYYTARVGVGLRGVPTASRVYCVDSESAKILWTFPDGGGLSAPAIASDRVYIWEHTVFLLPRRLHRQTAVDLQVRSTRRGVDTLYLPRQGLRSRRRWLRPRAKIKNYELSDIFLPCFYTSCSGLALVVFRTER